MERQRPAAMLLVMAGFLAVECAMNAAGLLLSAGLTLAMAIGAENTVLQKQGQSGVGLTYMTGTLVRLGQRPAEH